MQLTPALFQRLADLLQRPDPPDLPPRRHRQTQIGDYERRRTVLIPLLIRWAQVRIIMREESV